MEEGEVPLLSLQARAPVSMTILLLALGVLQVQVPMGVPRIVLHLLAQELMVVLLLIHYPLMSMMQHAWKQCTIRAPKVAM